MKEISFRSVRCIKYSRVTQSLLRLRSLSIMSRLTAKAEHQAKSRDHVVIRIASDIPASYKAAGSTFIVQIAQSDPIASKQTDKCKIVRQEPLVLLE